MMKYIAFLFSFAVACSVAAGVSEDATVLTIGTAGPDSYADGTTVLDGECYALVWRAPGRAFAGFRSDGSPVESAYAKVLCLAPLASGGKCPETTFVVDSRVLAACGTGGTFGLYLLDSRRWDSGEATVGGLKGVHGSVLVSETTSVEGFLAGSASGATAFLASAVPAGFDCPTITGIRVEGDEVVLSVTNTASTVNYNVAGGVTVAADEKGAAAENPVAGGAKATDPIELRVKRATFGDKAFFKIVRNPLEIGE